MNMIRSTDKQYLTPEEMAELADEVRTDSHSTIADHLGVSKSSVSLAFSQPSTRRVKTLGRILRLYGIDVDIDTPRYVVDQ